MFTNNRRISDHAGKRLAGECQVSVRCAIRACARLRLTQGNEVKNGESLKRLMITDVLWYIVVAKAAGEKPSRAAIAERQRLESGVCGLLAQ